ncbi:APC family permease [Lacticaseibacillus paracasei]|uniref:APC family permease n=1 Tax=Lacticaseibacillus paracasei TaxID=1597 RepID=UPI0008FF43C3|nr:APC family permease [Lacticaseibacillus paracasei]OJF73803.1 amino acid transporter [Lacticaseibacillus casei]RDF82151.1 amino acid permease [Lacticaseibacillus paracasei]RNE26704.1 Serine/threonine exchanger SteT [Lacticaseibacillus paracasei]TEA87108.1 amino acid transporter [Lacticaseibacillus paracasei]
MRKPSGRHRGTNKTLSFASVILLGINGIIGSGIFLLPGTLYQEAGLGSVSAIVLAGLSTTLIALSYAMLASKIDDDGGAWVYSNRAFGAFGAFVGFQTGWFGWFLGVITIAAELAAFLTALGGLIPVVKQRGVYISVALVIIAALIAINLIGPNILTFIDNISSALKIIILIAVIAAGGYFISTHGLHVSQPQAVSSDFRTAFYMFTGFSFLPVAANKMKNPEKTLPRALMVVMLIVIAIYGMAQMTTIVILSTNLTAETLPVAAAFATVVGSIGKTVAILGMLISILGVAVAVSFDTPIEMASLATEKTLLPAVFGRTNKSGAPFVAIWLTIGIAAMLVVSGSYLFLVNLIVFSAFLQYITTILAWFKLRHDPTLPAGIHLPMAPLLMGFALLLIGYLMTSATWLTWLIAVIVALIGSVIYATDTRRRGE